MGVARPGGCHERSLRATVPVRAKNVRSEKVKMDFEGKTAHFGKNVRLVLIASLPRSHIARRQESENKCPEVGGGRSDSAWSIRRS